MSICLQKIRINPARDRRDEFKQRFDEYITRNSAGLGNLGNIRLPQNQPQDKLEGIIEEMNELKSKADAFKGGHQSPEFRRLNEGCFKIQKKLDDILIEGDGPLRQKKQNTLKQVQNVQKGLNRRVHEKCDKCT